MFLVTLQFADIERFLCTKCLNALGDGYHMAIMCSQCADKAGLPLSNAFPIPKPIEDAFEELWGCRDCKRYGYCGSHPKGRRP